jgi:hypothetical protein
MEIDVTPKITMSFPGAIQRVVDGDKITKLEWGDPSLYIFLGEGFLRIRKVDGTKPQLLVSEADMLGNDWVVVSGFEKK